MIILLYTVILCRSFNVIAYSNKLFTITKQSNNQDVFNCSIAERYIKLSKPDQNVDVMSNEVPSSWNMKFMVEKKSVEKDPFVTNHDFVYKLIFGEGYGVSQDFKNETKSVKRNLLHFPTGRALREAELFNQRISVHFPITELLHPGYCMLKVTQDYMQTAVDAFAIFVKGDLTDIKRLPADYVLNSARTISMMKISHEKLAATWTVVKGEIDPIDVSYETLEKYRPLFKYLSGQEMSQLNLSDHRILNYIGTHPDLNRHQVGLVASKYIKINRRWSEPKYLNLMNNLLCGMPITYMRDISENTYLQLSHQVFYHTRACDPLQRRFYLSMMTRTQALGKSYSWNVQDVSRLGLLLAEVDGKDLGSIKPEALAGLTAQVVMAMRPKNLQYLTDLQLRYVGDKPFNILSKKLKKYKDRLLSGTTKPAPLISVLVLNIVIKFCTV